MSVHRRELLSFLPLSAISGTLPPAEATSLEQVLNRPIGPTRLPTSLELDMELTSRPVNSSAEPKWTRNGRTRLQLRGASYVAFHARAQFLITESSDGASFTKRVHFLDNSHEDELAHMTPVPANKSASALLGYFLPDPPPGAHLVDTPMGTVISGSRVQMLLDPGSRAITQIRHLSSSGRLSRTIQFGAFIEGAPGLAFPTEILTITSASVDTARLTNIVITP